MAEHSRVPEMKTDPELLRLLEAARNAPPPTAREKLEQKRSWVRGEMLFDGKLSEAEVDALLLNIPEFALLSQLDASLARERALREALAKAIDPRPAKQCPNCGGWTHLGDCNHSSSGPTGTLYGVCKKCADRHAAFSKAIGG